MSKQLTKNNSKMRLKLTFRFLLKFENLDLYNINELDRCSKNPNANK